MKDLLNQPAFKVEMRNGTYRVPMVKPGGRIRWIDLRTNIRADAINLVLANGVDRLFHVALAESVTAEVLSICSTGRNKKCRAIFDNWTAGTEGAKSKRTHTIYIQNVGRFLFNGNFMDKPITFIKKKDVFKWVNHPETKFSTRQLKLASLNAFFSYANAHALLVGNPAQQTRIDLDSMSVAELEPNAVLAWTADDFRKFMAHPDVDDTWKILASLAWWCGFRLSDVAKLEWQSLTLRPGFILIYAQKNRDRLALPLIDPIIGTPELYKTLDKIMAMGRTDDRYCFPWHQKAYDKGTPNLSQSFTKACINAGLGEGKTFHGLRHGFKKRLLDAGRPLSQISEYMGHSKQATTAGYGNYVAESQ